MPQLLPLTIIWYNFALTTELPTSCWPGNSCERLAMTGASRPQRSSLSLSFLNRKKKTNYCLGKVAAARPDSPETCLEEILQSLANENEEHLIRDGADHGQKNVLEDYKQPEENSKVNLTPALVFRPSPSLDLNQGWSLGHASTSYKSNDIAYPPLSSSGKNADRTSSTKAFDSSSRSGSLRTESTSQKSTGALTRGWLSKRCGFRSCSKQIDMEAELRSKDSSGAARRLLHRAQRSGTKSTGPTTSLWERNWRALTEQGNDVVRKKVVWRTKEGPKMSRKRSPSPAISPSLAVHPAKSDMKCSLTDDCDELREAATYGKPRYRADQQKAATEVNSSRGHQMQDTSTDINSNAGEVRGDTLDRSFSSSSSDEELFTTSFELDCRSKSRKKQWSSNSSDETESRHRRTPGSHVRSKSTRSYQSHRSAVQEENIVQSRKTRSKKGSRIIFLSTPPRPVEFGMNDSKGMTTNQLVSLSSIDCSGEYCEVEPTTESGFVRAFPSGYAASQAPSSPTPFQADTEASGFRGEAKALSKLEVRSTRTGDVINDMIVRELPIVSRSNMLGKYRLRHIGVQVEDQLINLRLESDSSECTEGNTCNHSLGTRRYLKGSPTFLDQEKPAKRKRGTRRNRGCRNKAPPPLPTDLHGKVKESVAVVKSSYNPYNDFRDSMVEMILEKEIQGASDLEELLRCYLSLNSGEYHSVIVKVFADVWRQLFADAI